MSKNNRPTQVQKTQLHPYARYIAVALFAAVLAGQWDVWWHGAIGRDTFFEPPHLLLYGAVVVAVLLGIKGWRQTKDLVDSIPDSESALRNCSPALSSALKSFALLISATAD